MNGIQLQPMSRYKRTDFEEDETSSTTSMQADALMVGGGSARGGGGGGGGMAPGSGVPHIRYHGHPRNLWQRASVLERLLMIVVLVLLLIIIILSAILDSKSGFPPVKVVHVTSTNYTTAPPPPRKATPTEYCLTPACVTVASSILNAMDHTADPCKDFYQYACGGWIKSNPLPDGKSLWGTFGQLWQENQLVMKNLLEVENPKYKSKSELKAITYYYSCLDKNKTIEELGPHPIEELIEEIGGWNITGNFNVSNWNFQKTLQLLHNKYNRGGLFTWGVGEDERNSSRNIIEIDQGGLGLPTRDYYLNDTKEYKDMLEAYLTFMTTVGVLLGGEENATRRQMEEVLTFETLLAVITVPADERRDDEQLYHKMKLNSLQQISPFIEWVPYFKFAFSQINKEIDSSQEVVVYAPDFLKNLTALINLNLATDEGKITLSNYLVWSLVQSVTPYLSKPFREALKAFREALIGSEGGESQWRYCVSDTNNIIGFALGAMFVREVFHGENKAVAEEMINEIRDAFKKNLPMLSWMDDETRELAREKADAITDMIGFPNFILDPEKLDKKYDGLEFSEDTYFENNIRASQFALLSNMKKLDKPANVSEWQMTPPTVNAYYTPTKNQMVFPAGILQAPFYDPNYPKSLNFGAMGVVMGHELTHAFDDQGREYDKEGNLHQWWKNSTIKSFQDRTQCFVDQYSSFEVNSEHVNGKQTLGENIADNGGLKAAYHAYNDWVKTHLAELLLPGVNLTHNQLFFIGFSQVWCSSSTPKAMHVELVTDAHSPSEFRVRGSLSNSHEFANEFKCPSGSPMNPKKKCEVW